MTREVLARGTTVHILLEKKQLTRKPASCIAEEGDCYKIPGKVLKYKNGVYTLIARVNGERTKYRVHENYIITPAKND